MAPSPRNRVGMLLDGFNPKNVHTLLTEQRNTYKRAQKLSQFFSVLCISALRLVFIVYIYRPIYEITQIKKQTDSMHPMSISACNGARHHGHKHPQTLGKSLIISYTTHAYKEIAPGPASARLPTSAPVADDDESWPGKNPVPAAVALYNSVPPEKGRNAQIRPLDLPPPPEDCAESQTKKFRTAPRQREVR